MSRFSIATLVMVLAVSAPLSAAEFDIDWFTIDGGGGTSAGGSFELSGTIGQWDAGSPAMPMTGGDFELVGGFWVIASAPAPCPGDTNGDGTVDNLDLQAILDAWASMTGDPNYTDGADLNDDGTVDNFDLQELLDNWQNTCP